MDLRVLIFEEDLSIYNLVKESSLLPKESVYFLDTQGGLFNFILNNDIQVVITEREQDHSDGISLLQDIKAFDPLVDVVLVGKKLGLAEVADMIKKGASDYLARPVKEPDMDRTLKKIIQKRELRKKTYELESDLEKKYSFEGMVGRSPYMLEIFSLIERVSPYFTSVVVTGEEGTGRGLVAQALHNLSPVENRELVTYDCLSAPRRQFEPQLFGYRKEEAKEGQKIQEGLLRKANKGTLFLDEVSEMPVSFQKKLAKVLEKKKVKPMGGTKYEEVDVRVIASTSGNLKELVTKRKFRKHLFQFLNKVEIQMPPLRERAEDIPFLVKHFLRKFNKKWHKNVRGVSQRVQKFLHSYEWPGNVRELRDVMESAVEVTDKKFVDIDDLPEYFQESLEKPKKIPFIRREDLSTLDALEKEYISYLLKVTEDNMTKTAKILGISRSTLYNKIKEYNIPH